MSTARLDALAVADLVRRPTILGAGERAVRLELDQPPPGSVIRVDQPLLGYGWALGASPIRAIDVSLDSEKLCSAVIGLSRLDIAELYECHSGSDRAGFRFFARLPPGARNDARLRLTLVTEAGEQDYTLPLGIVGGAETPAAEPQPPIASLPDPPADLEPIRLVVEEARFDAGGRLSVRGWAVAWRQVRSVEVFIGQRSVGKAETGQSRADVAAAHPAYPDAAASGFVMTVPLSAEQGGAEIVTVVVTDGAGETLSADRETTSTSGRAAGDGAVQAPEGAPLVVTLEEACIDQRGILRVRGWAVGLAVIEQVQVFVGDDPLGIAYHNLPRDDVRQAHPTYPNAHLAGFQLQTALPNRRPLGETLRVVVAAACGGHHEVAAPVTAAS